MVCGGLVNWKSQLQSIVALSTTTAKYTVATKAIKEIVWLQGLLNELEMLERETVQIIKVAFI